MKGALPAIATAVLATATALAGEALTRSGFNIDFNATSGVGAGVPAATFGAAADQPGVWNSIGTAAIAPGTSFPVTGVDGVSAASLNITFTGANLTSVSLNNANTTGEHEKLLDDILDLGAPGRTFTVTITGLAPGVYEVYTYASAPDSDAYRTDVGLFGRPKTSVGGAFPVNGFAEGVTHARQRCAIGGFNTAIQINIEVPTVAGTSNLGSLAGIQIKPLNPARLYVKPTTATTYTDGLSWDTAVAFTSLAAQIAGTTPSVTEVWAARTAQATSGIATRLRNGLTLSGGFLGVETALGDRPPVNAFDPSSLTHLSGDPNSVGADPLPHVVIAGGTDATAVIDGFWITGGVADNAGDTAGGGLYAFYGAPTVRNCRFSGNSATFGGGAIYSQNDSTIGVISISDCVITGNSAPSGGGLNFRAETRVTLNRCAITANHATAGSGGGAFSLGSLTLTSCLLADNTASAGGGAVYHQGFSTVVADTITLLNCTAARNTASASGGVFAGGPAYTVRNSILWGNASAGSLRARQFATTLTVIDSITDSTVQGWDGVLATPSALDNDADPRFANPAAGDYHLTANSPAIDTGWNNGLPGAATARDLDGNPRLYDDPGMANAGFAGGTIDRGCFERAVPSAPCLGDIGRTGGLEGPDGLKDNNDLVVFISWFFAPDSRADVGRTGGAPGPDGEWDNNDFVVYIDLFFAPCP